MNDDRSDKIRELPERWRDRADNHAKGAWAAGRDDGLRRAARELEEALNHDE